MNRLLVAGLALAQANLLQAAVLQPREASSMTAKSSSTSSPLPNYFQTTPEIFQGPTATGVPAFEAQTVVVPSSASFAPATPLQTQVPIVDNPSDENIFQLHGQLSHYFPGPGFGVNEYSLPKSAKIVQLHMLSRHGSRYPTTGADVYTFGSKVANLTGKFNATGPLAFLNTWKFKLGAEILTPIGRSEMFDSGVDHAYKYGALYNSSQGTGKVLARTTSQDRMLKSAEYFMAGFFGQNWVDNATLEVQLEQSNYNTSLAGYFRCNNSNIPGLAFGSQASSKWQSIYLANATQRLGGYAGAAFNWTGIDSYAAQSLCAYETVALGYSSFCALFTAAEWEGYEYSVDLNFNGNDGFGSPSGRAVGIGYQQEFMARLQNMTLSFPPYTNANSTYDNNTALAPTPQNQSLFFDFSHDTNMHSILTAFGLKQFGAADTPLPATGPPPANRSMFVSHLEPFGARFDFEVIYAPTPIPADRKTDSTSGKPTFYIHLLISQRTVPLDRSLPQCEKRADGWCELGAFIDSQKDALKLANYDYACHGKYNVTAAQITNGAPPSSQ